MEGKINKLNVLETDKTNIIVKEGSVIVKKGISSTKVDVMNKEIIFDSIKSLEYRDNKFEILGNINMQSLM